MCKGCRECDIYIRLASNFVVVLVIQDIIEAPYGRTSCQCNGCTRRRHQTSFRRVNVIDSVHDIGCKGVVIDIDHIDEIVFIGVEIEDETCIDKGSNIASIDIVVILALTLILLLFFESDLRANS